MQKSLNTIILSGIAFIGFTSVYAYNNYHLLKIYINNKLPYPVKVSNVTAQYSWDIIDQQSWTVQSGVSSMVAQAFNDLEQKPVGAVGTFWQLGFPQIPVLFKLESFCGSQEYQRHGIVAPVLKEKGDQPLVSIKCTINSLPHENSTFTITVQPSDFPFEKQIECSPD